MGNICSACGHDNPSGLRVCARCAQELANLCPSCGFENPAGFKFCGQCGANLAALRLTHASSGEQRRLQSYIPTQVLEKMVQHSQGMKGERRTVAILFCDLSGFTSMSERLDPEEVYSIMDELLGSFVEEIYRYEGMVDKFTGDGLMALFGAPLAHEDDAERSVHAALGMQAALRKFNESIAESHGVTLKCRIGLNMGEVIAGELGSDLRLDYTVMGDAVNVAARLEQAAEPGSILVSEEIYRATEPIFEFSEVGELSLKGRAARVRAYRLVRERVLKGRTRGIRGLEAPLIGRERELSQIVAATQTCLQEGKGQLVLVTGEAGIGKSRLTAEWRQWLADRDVTVWQGAPLSHTTAIAWWFMRDMLRGYFRLSDDDPLDQAREKVARRVADVMGEGTPGVLPYVQNLISPDIVSPEYAHRVQQLTPAELRQQTFLAVRDLLSAEAARRPVILICEDVHWMDRPSLDLLLFLLGLLESAPILVYCISRPDEGVAITELARVGQEQYERQTLAMHLGPLSRGDVDRLLDELLAAPDLPETFRQVIPEWAEGNPFFLEEIVRMMIDRDLLRRDADGRWSMAEFEARGVEVPRTLRGLILTRVDSLGDLQREVLQCAAVVGRSFHKRLLERVVSAPAVLERNLDGLAEHGLIDRRPGGDDVMYAFHHALTQEAVYGTLLRSDRQKLHRLVGEAIEQVYMGRLDEQIEILAHHFYQGDVPDRALGYLIEAGKRSAGRYANDEALEYYRRALSLRNRTSPSTEQMLDIQVGLADVKGFLAEYDEALRHYDEALGLIAAGAPGRWTCRMAEVQRKAARAWERKGDYEEANARLQSVLALLADASDPEEKLERARAYNDLGWVAFRQGDLDAAERWTRQALREMGNGRSSQDVAAAYNRLAGISYQQGEWDLAAEFAERGLELRESIGYTYGVAMSYNNLSVIYMAGGNWAQGIRYAERSLEMKQRMGDVEGMGISFNNLGMAYKDRGDLARARDYLLRSLSTAKRIKNANLLASTLSNLGQVALQASNWPDTIGYLEESLQVATASGSKDQIAEALWLLTEAWIRAGNLERAEQTADQASRLAGEVSARSVMAIAERTKGMLLRMRGDPEGALVPLGNSLEHFTDLRNQLEIGRIYVQMGLSLADLGRVDEAMNSITNAALIFDALGADQDGRDARCLLESWRSRISHAGLRD